MIEREMDDWLQIYNNLSSLQRKIVKKLSVFYTLFNQRRLICKVTRLNHLKVR